MTDDKNRPDTGLGMRFDEKYLSLERYGQKTVRSVKKRVFFGSKSKDEDSRCFENESSRMSRKKCFPDHFDRYTREFEWVSNNEAILTKPFEF